MNERDRALWCTRPDVGILAFPLLPGLAVGFLPPTNWDHKAQLVSREYASLSGQGNPGWIWERVGPNFGFST